MTLVVNLLGGPGSGKSTTAAGVFYELKTSGVNCELITEYAKDKTWLKDYRTLQNQIYVFANQYHRIWRVADQVDVVITDSPILLSAIYGTTSDLFKALVVETFNEYENLTYFINRAKPFNPAGRSQTEEEAKLIDFSILDTLMRYEVEYEEVLGDKNAVQIILEKIRGINSVR